MRVLCCGFVVADLIAAGLPKIPEPGDIVYSTLGVKLRTGGHPTNVSIDLMQMGLTEGDVGIVGCVGDDMFADFIEGYLRAKKVVTFLERSKSAETTKTLALVVRGEDRRFICEPGASTMLSFEHVKMTLSNTMPDIFYQAGGLLGEYDFMIAKVFDASRESGVVNVFDFAPRPYGKDWSYALPAIGKSDIVHCNDMEVKWMTGIEDVRKAAMKMAEHGAKLVIVSLGGSGLNAYYKREGAWIKQEAFKVEAVDPTGAGDALVAGTIYKLLSKGIRRGKGVEGLSLEDVIETLAYAQASGAACVTEIGTTPGVTKDNIERILKEQGERVINSTKIERNR